MGIVYLAALIIGLGTILLQLLLSSSDSAGAGTHVGGADLHADGDGSSAAHSETDVAGFFALFLSLRFWVFALLAFGMTGALCTWLHLGNALVTFVLALAMGLGSGLLAAWVVHALGRATIGSSTSSDESVGAVGRVLLPCGRERPGKIRIQLRGQSIDLLARSDGEEIPVGAAVLVEAVQAGEAVVSRAPDELDPAKR